MTVLVSTEIASQLVRKQFTRSNVSRHSTQFKGQECMVSPASQVKCACCSIRSVQRSSARTWSEREPRGEAVHSLLLAADVHQVGLLNVIALSSSPLPELSSLMR